MRTSEAAAVVTGTDELVDARLLVEPHNAAEACRRAAPAATAELQEALDTMVNSPRGPGFVEYRPFLEADAEFHAVIGRHCGNSFLADAVEHFASHVRRFSLFGPRGVSDGDWAIKEHGAILDAFEANDPDAAAAAMREHLNGVRERSLREMERADQEACARGDSNSQPAD